MAGAVGRSGRFDELLPGYLCSGVLGVYRILSLIRAEVSGQSFRRSRIGMFGCQAVLIVGGLPPGCPGCRGDVGDVCRRCSGCCRGAGREAAEMVRAGRYSVSFCGFSQRILPFSGKICIFVPIAGKCGPVFASLLNPRADEDFAGFGLIIKKK